MAQTKAQAKKSVRQQVANKEWWTYSTPRSEWRIEKALMEVVYQAVNKSLERYGQPPLTVQQWAKHFDETIQPHELRLWGYDPGQSEGYVTGTADYVLTTPIRYVVCRCDSDVYVTLDPMLPW